MEQCIHQIQKGDYSSLCEVYASCLRGFIRSVCRKKPQEKDDAWDAFHQAIVLTIDNIQHGVVTRFTHGLEEYVCTIARNIYLKKKNRQMIHEHYCRSQRRACSFYVPAEAEEKMDNEYFSAMLSRVLGRLQPEDRAMFDLFYYQGLDNEEIMRKMKYRNIHSVRNRLGRLIRKVAGMMKESGIIG